MTSRTRMRDRMKPRFLGWLDPHGAREIILLDDGADLDGTSNPRQRTYRIRDARRGPSGDAKARAGVNLTGEELDALVAWWRRERRVRRGPPRRG